MGIPKGRAPGGLFSQSLPLDRNEVSRVIPFLCFASLAFSTQSNRPEAPKELHVWVSRNVAPSSKIQVNINTRNIPVVHVTGFPVDGLRWLANPRLWNVKPAVTGPAISHFDLTIAAKEQYMNPRDNYFARQVNLPHMKSGVYLLNVAAQGQEAWGVVNVTNLEVVAKRSPYRSLVWVTRFKTGAVIKDAKVSFYDNTGACRYSAKTGEDGAALIAMPHGLNTVVVQTKDEIAGLQASANNPNGRLRCLFQTDRPIYRPGQTISYKAILRLTHEQVYDSIRNAPVKVQLRDPRDNPLDEATLVSNDLGSVAGSFKLPTEGMLGAYTLVLTCQNRAAFQTFTVAAYRKPEYKVDVKPAQKRYLAGQELHFAVDTAYYFGAPVPQASVQWVVRRNTSPFNWSSPEDRWFYGGDGNLYPRDTYASSPFAADGQGVTDNKGHLDIVIKSDPAAPDSNYSVQLTVIDSSRRQVTGSASVPVYTAAIRLGISCLRETVAIGDLVPIEVRLIDLDRLPKRGAVRFQVITQIWDKKRGEFVPKVLSRKQIEVPTTGVSTITLPALASGDLTIRAETTDETGRIARSEASIWVAGMDYKPEKDEDGPSLDLKIDKRSYTPGDKVHAFAITNRPLHPVLFVLSGGDLWNYKVVQPHKAIAMCTFDTSTRQSPNAYVTVCQWNEGGLQAGNEVVPLPDRTKLLKVEVKADKAEYKPGERATYRVRTLDQRGHGVPAEVSVAVVDEAIYALSQDSTPDPYLYYWGWRADEVLMYQSAPEELSGGAFQNVSSVAPVRQRFEDTAFWNAFVQTDANGQGVVSFEMPGNLTSWRTTARAVTQDTRVGSTFSNVTATRLVTLRLATPRMAAQGDQIAMVATVNNRTARAMRFELNLRAEGVSIDNETKQELEVGGKGEGTVRWRLHVKDVPTSGMMKLTARVGAIGSTDPDYGDALSVSVPVVPRGVLESTHLGGVIGKTQTESLNLPADTLPQGSLVTIRISGGVQAIARETAARLYANGRYGTMWAVNALKAAVATQAPNNSEDVKEAFALLSRDQLYNGWGWWEGAPADPKITAEVGYALALAEQHGYTVYQSIRDAAVNGCDSLYRQTNLWEDRARLAASLKALKATNGDRFVSEVAERGLNLSPFAKLRLAEVLLSTQADRAQEYLDNVLKLVSDGPSSAYVPVGFGIGWSASDTETTAELLTVLHLARQQTALQTRLARRLAIPGRAYTLCPEDSAAIVIALSQYGQDHPDAKSIGEAEVTVNGKQFSLLHSTVDVSASVEIRDTLLHGGANTVQLRRSGDGEAFFTVQARVYRPLLTESILGVRVARRFEVRNEAGVWTEVTNFIKPGEPVRCTVVVWGDDISDALRVTEPIPAGFEYVDSDYTSYSREEVRDGALAHYLLNSGTPTYFRYYLRAEADGRLIALPATAEYLRRPATHGRSSASEVVVHP
jgi:uncharacterized protein YfaS (alpha-2-macroglobulin family)